ncbi:hypothetical protein Gotur_011876 [Gossypium turneri]
MVIRLSMVFYQCHRKHASLD